MIKKAVIVNTPTSEIPHKQYLNVEFTDGTFVNLDEEELKNAAWKLGKLNATEGNTDDQQLEAFENEGGSTYSEQMQDALEPIEGDEDE